VSSQRSQAEVGDLSQSNQIDFGVMRGRRWAAMSEVIADLWQRQALR
jgi:hypothetical protein